MQKINILANVVMGDKIKNHRHSEKNQNNDILITVWSWESRQSSVERV